MGLLTFHRFEASIVLFNVAVIIVAVQLLIKIFSVHSLWWKCAFILIVYIGAIACAEYLMGVVKQGETEYYTSIITNDALASRIAAKTPYEKAEDLRRQQRLKVRTELARLMTRDVEIKEKCLSDEPPVGFSCMNEYLRLRNQTRAYLKKNMEPSYLARFIAIDEPHTRYQKIPSGKFLEEGEVSNAVNLLSSCAKKLEEFIKDFPN